MHSSSSHTPRAWYAFVFFCLLETRCGAAFAFQLGILIKNETLDRTAAGMVQLLDCPLPLPAPRCLLRAAGQRSDLLMGNRVEFEEWLQTK